jgi:hypothetical protein
MDVPTAVNAKSAAKKKSCWSVREAGKMLGGVHGCVTTTCPGRRLLIPNSPLGAQRSARQLRRQLRFRKLRSAPRLRAGLVKNRVRFDYTYLYDDAGNRVQETTGGTTSFYLTDTANPTGYAQPLEVWTSTSDNRSTATLQETYILGDRVLGQANAGGTLGYLLADGQGDTRLITSATGTVTAALSYDAGGDVTSSSGSASTIFEYPDGPVDPVSGLRMPGDGTRDEEIAEGEFIERDFGPEGTGNNSNPITLNAELYGDGDPVNNDDPTGHYSYSSGDYAFALASSMEAEPFAFGNASYMAGESPFLPDPTQKPPGWEPSWPTGIQGPGQYGAGKPYVENPSTGQKYFPHEEDPLHWPHYDRPNGDRYPENCFKPQPGQKNIKPNSNVSPTNPWDNIAKAVLVADAFATSVAIIDAGLDLAIGLLLAVE